MSQTNNYIFISYAHKDSDEVLPIVQALKNNGYEVWFDEGIEAGTEWPEYIAQQLKNCAVVLAFISPNAVASNNCRNEINYALSLQKPLLAVYLSETEMTAGMELQLGSIQAIFKYRHQTDETFIRALAGANILQPLRGDVFTKTAVTPVQPTQPTTPKKKVEPAKTKRTSACKRILTFVCLLGMIAGTVAVHYLTPYYDGFTLGLLITAILVCVTSVPVGITIGLIKRAKKKYSKGERKQIYEDIGSILVVFWFLATVFDGFFVRSTDTVIWKILISIGINLLRYFILFMCTPDDE